MMRAHRLVFACLSLLLCAGCAMTDPYEHSGMWQPDGAVQADMAAQVADPHDLIEGHGPASPAHYGPDGVLQLWADHPKALLTNSDSSTGSGASSGNNGSSGGGN